MSPVFRRGSEVSVLMINAQGIMISVQGCDYFLSYNRIPWMQDAPIRSVLNVQMSGPEAIEWPDLDVDLEIDSLRHPERYPLVIKTESNGFCVDKLTDEKTGPAKACPALFYIRDTRRNYVMEIRL